MPEVRSGAKEDSLSNDTKGEPKDDQAFAPNRTASPTSVADSDLQPEAKQHRRQPSQNQYKTTTPISSHVFLINGYEQIMEAKSTRKFSYLKSDTQRALDLAKSEGFSKERAQLPHNIEVVLQPFLSACQTASQTLTLIALDALTKMISHDYLCGPSSARKEPPSSSSSTTSDAPVKKDRTPMEKAVLAICSCFIGENTDDKVQTQVIRGLMAAVSSNTTPLHQEALLNSIRTLYNIFLLSRDINNQIIAQGTLVQMARTVFGRIELKQAANVNGRNRSCSTLSSKTGPSTSDFISRYGANDELEEEKDVKLAPQVQLSLEAIAGKAAEAAANAQVQGNICDTSSDLNVLDGFLLFRALCKLSIKPYQSEGSSDVRCMSLRSKLLSLYLILITLSEFSTIFTEATVFFLTPAENESSRRIREVSFLSAVKPYFCLSLSRNMVTNLPKVYEIAIAIFELALTTMRHQLKREIEVFLKEIVMPILEMKPSGNQHQKHILTTMLLTKICNDPQVLVEIYLNYDCDRGSLNNNIFERLTGALSKLTVPSRNSEMEDPTNFLWEEPDAFYINSSLMNRNDLLSLPPLTSDRFTGYFISHSFFSRSLFSDANLQQRSLECLVGILKSLVQWSKKGVRIMDDDASFSSNLPFRSGSIDEMDSESQTSGVVLADDPSEFEKNKQEKQILQKAIELFNRKPKKGVECLINAGFIPSSEPRDIAYYLLSSEELDKAMIGDYLGEADPVRVSIMHAFVDALDFSDLDFVTALRKFLKTFRLPGEAQKIDRFMLKFADRYVEQNPKVFANADTGYVLAYSVIMLNTDLHNPQVKRRMTKEEFLKNNRGINDSTDLPDEYLMDIYDQIAATEIQLKDSGDEEENRPLATGLAAQFDILGSLQKSHQEAERVSGQMQSNVERYLKKMISRKSHREDMGGMAIFYSASHFEHVRPMFEISWMAHLAAISGPLKQSDSPMVVGLCLDGFRYAIHIAGFFDLDLARNAFVTTLGNFSFLSDISEMRPRNIEAIKTILEIAVTEGNYLKQAWNDVLQVVNHLVRLQIVPNFSATTNGRDRSLVAHRDGSHRNYTHIAMLEGNSQNMLIAVDKVFAASVHLNGPAIVDFVQALCGISWGELETMPKSFDRAKTQTSPRMFSIQKVVEIAYYNMHRIRLEWKDIWSILGPLFNQLGCHRNEAISSFALDSLRQLAMKFLEKKELPHYRFQKEFLKPFVFIASNNHSHTIRDMILQCTQQMIKLYASNITSGWETLLEILGRTARDHSDDLPVQAFEQVRELAAIHFDDVVAQPDVFSHYLMCIAQFTRNTNHHDLAIQAVELYKATCDRMIENCESQEGSQPFSELDFWLPIFQGLMETVTQVVDLDVRTSAMDHIFTYLHEFGGFFPQDFWNHILNNVLFPLFSNIGKLDHKVRVRFASKEDALEWVSTTLVHALRRFVHLFTEYFEKAFKFLSGLLDLLSVCLCQDNATLCKIGSDCLKLLVETNVEKLGNEDWERLISIIVRLFKATSPTSDPNLALTVPTRDSTKAALDRLEALADSSPLPVIPNTPEKQLNLCLITISIVEDVFLQNDAVFGKLDPNHIFIILDIMEKAYLETQRANGEFDLKGLIQRQAVTKLEKFASTSLSLELNCLACLIKVLVKMYISDAPEFTPYRCDIESRLIP
ncbi:guanine nucleotide exchange protein for ADP-robosylation factor, variant 2 [Entomophthora muscae]|nr:guanine nucleotide exchange protein for ADP-robosylation factor, variant 2 [Entomophthora muscae]